MFACYYYSPGFYPIQTTEPSRFYFLNSKEFIKIEILTAEKKEKKRNNEHHIGHMLCSHWCSILEVCSHWLFLVFRQLAVVCFLCGLENLVYSVLFILSHLHHLIST